jgi:hypothetical protein
MAENATVYQPYWNQEGEYDSSGGLTFVMEDGVTNFVMEDGTTPFIMEDSTFTQIPATVFNSDAGA